MPMSSLEKNREQINAPRAPEGSPNNVDSDLDTVSTLGNVSEVLGEATEVSKGGGQKKSRINDEDNTVDSNTNLNALKEKYLSEMPAQDKAIKEIEFEIRKEIKGLEKRIKQLSKSKSPSSFFELVNVVKKVRELKGVLSSLFKASFDTVKALYLRFKHGIR